MKVYQCIHKYPHYIASFESRYNIKSRNLTFDQIISLLLEDGFYIPYILKPAIEKKNDIVFYTIWDYEYLQYKWAEENNLNTRNLGEIKLAQIESFKPDVFYNFSPRNDDNFIDKINKIKTIKKICWDAIISEYPWLHEKYDMRFTLFEPYVAYWKSKGLVSELFSPSANQNWIQYIDNKRDIDILFYGQASNLFFNKRNMILYDILKWGKSQKYNVQIYLDGLNKKIPFINIKGLRKLTKFKHQFPASIRKAANGPIFGNELYNTIGRAKIVVNAYTDYNGLFKDNMRTYETISCGAIMVAQDGIFPKFIQPDKDILTYRDTDELIDKLSFLLNNNDQLQIMAKNSQMKILETCSKEKQWLTFLEIINKL